MKRALKGINVGGWLVAERWMTPALFKGVEGGGELALSRELGVAEARKRLTQHRDKFITEKDFKDIKQLGFDFVRLPIGYWLFDGTDDFIDGEHYIDKAFTWAKQYDLGIILDFHGLQGSQNGRDHSGQVGDVRLYKADNVSRALSTVEYMSQKYGQHSQLLGFELINEPHIGWCLRRLLSYYDAAYETAAVHLGDDVKIIVSDAFHPRRLARVLKRRSYGDRIVLDVHLYQVFSRRDKAMTFDQHIRMASETWEELVDDISKQIPVMVGEWSAALPGDAYSGVEVKRRAQARRYYFAQQQAFENTAWAHAYWTYKAPGCGLWDWQTAQSYLD